MLEIKDVKVYDLKESIIASGYAMRLDPYDYVKEDADNFQKHLQRIYRLKQSSQESDIKCHDNALTGIRVSFDLKYPGYISPELQRYHFFDIVTSMSKMHRLLKMDIKASCTKYTGQKSIQQVQEYIDAYNKVTNMDDSSVKYPFQVRYPNSNELATINNKNEWLYHIWMCAISSCPMGIELWMRCSTNYKQLQTIYAQRKNHKLKEDWGAFCEMIKSLPYSNLITND